MKAQKLYFRACKAFCNTPVGDVVGGAACGRKIKEGRKKDVGDVSRFSACRNDENQHSRGES